MRTTLSTRRFAVLAAAAATAIGGGMIALSPSASAGPAAFTSVDFTVQPDVGQCLHGNPSVNCNDYTAKQFVWMNGGPAAANLANGDYFFAVVAPGGHHEPNDGSSKLLSTDLYPDRTFNVTDGVLTYGGPHPFDSTENKIQLIPFKDTPNKGGVYMMVICALDPGDIQPANPSCKSDAFKVEGTGGGGGGGSFSAPTAAKDATPFHGHNVAWTIAKSADYPDGSTIYSNTPVTVHYTVTATKTVTDEHWSVGGTIQVFNSNDTDMTLDGVTDQFAADYPELNATCSVTGTFPATVPAGDAGGPGESDFPYSCSFSGVANTPDYTVTYDNRASLTYEDPTATPTTTTIDDAADAIFSFPQAATLDAGSDPESVTVSDTNSSPVGSPGTGTTISDTTVFTYPVTFSNNLCVTHPNTATIAVPGADPQPDTWPRTASWTVQFCGPNAGGLTQGWWQNKNGQKLLTSNTTSACTTLNGYLGSHTTLADLINVDHGQPPKLYVTGDCTNSSTFSYLPKFDLLVFGQATSTGTGWSMLLSQWLTTALDSAAYPTFYAAGKPALDPNAGIYNPNDVAGLNLGTCPTVSQLLTAAVNSFSSYSGDKSKVTALSSLFDAINNNKAVSC